MNKYEEKYLDWRKEREKEAGGQELCESIGRLRMNFAFARREMCNDGAVLLKRPEGKVLPPTHPPCLVALLYLPL